VTLRDPGSWLIKTVITLSALSIPTIACAQGHAFELLRDTWGGLTVFYGLLLGIKKAGDVAEQAVGVQQTKITGEPPVIPGDPPVTEVAS
jgi:hypothetical protein